MALIDTLRAQQLAARKARNQVEIGVYTTLLAEIQAIGKKYLREPTEAEAVNCTRKALDIAKENRGLSKTPEQIAQFDREIVLLTALMPQQMTPDQVRSAVQEFLAANPGSAIGPIMSHLKANYGGSYDGKAASLIVKEELNAGYGKSS